MLRALAFIILFAALMLAFDFYALWVIVNNARSAGIQILYLAFAALFISGFFLNLIFRLHLGPLLRARRNGYAFCVVESGAVWFCTRPDPVDLSQFEKSGVRRRRPPGKAYIVRELVFRSQRGEPESIINLGDLRGDADQFATALSKAMSRLQ